MTNNTGKMTEKEFKDALEKHLLQLLEEPDWDVSVDFAGEVSLYGNKKLSYKKFLTSPDGAKSSLHIIARPTGCRVIIGSDEITMNSVKLKDEVLEAYHIIKTEQEYIDRQILQKRVLKYFGGV